MVTDFVGQKFPVQYREVYESFTEYMFDLLPNYDNIKFLI